MSLVFHKASSLPIKVSYNSGTCFRRTLMLFFTTTASTAIVAFSPLHQANTLSLYLFQAIAWIWPRSLPNSGYF